MQQDNIKQRVTNHWELDGFVISHNVVDYHTLGQQTIEDDSNSVRLHYGLQGSYAFNLSQLSRSFELSGHHNNIMYSNGLKMSVQNKSKRIETFGVNFVPANFIAIGQVGNEPLRRFTEKMIQGKNAILSNHWKTNTFKIQQVIQEIIHCPYQKDLQQLFLSAKSLELLVLQVDLYQKQTHQPYIKTEKDRKKLLEAKELLDLHLDNPPTIIKLSQLIGINEFKLKKGFKELFGTTIFGYIQSNRMQIAKTLLLDTNQLIKEIADQLGYSSSQHFSTAFKRHFGQTPNHVRKTPNSKRY
ncbi:MAG: AraC family transcriptional regulator [Bacteroidota bacterium]